MSTNIWESVAIWDGKMQKGLFLFSSYGRSVLVLNMKTAGKEKKALERVIYNSSQETRYKHLFWAFF